jgi:hypothetical protein
MACTFLKKSVLKSCEYVPLKRNLVNVRPPAEGREYIMRFRLATLSNIYCRHIYVYFYIHIRTMRVGRAQGMTCKNFSTPT